MEQNRRNTKQSSKDPFDDAFGYPSFCNRIRPLCFGNLFDPTHTEIIRAPQRRPKFDQRRQNYEKVGSRGLAI